MYKEGNIRLFFRPKARSAVVEFKSGAISACIVMLTAYPPVTTRDFLPSFEPTVPLTID